MFGSLMQTGKLRLTLQTDTLVSLVFIVNSILLYSFYKLRVILLSSTTRGEEVDVFSEVDAFAFMFH